MADLAPSTPLPAGPERRVSPADQMAALTGEPVEISRPEDDEPAEDRDVTQDRQIDEPFEDGALRRCAGCRALVSRSPKTGSIPDAIPSGRCASFAPCPERRCALVQT